MAGFSCLVLKLYNELDCAKVRLYAMAAKLGFGAKKCFESLSRESGLKIIAKSFIAPRRICSLQFLRLVCRRNSSICSKRNNCCSKAKGCFVGIGRPRPAAAIRCTRGSHVSLVSDHYCPLLSTRPLTTGRVEELMNFHQNEQCTADEFDNFRQLVLKDFIVVKDFISENEENLLLREVEKALKRLRYEYDHWDGVIYGYREIEKSRWTPDCNKIIQRIQEKAFDSKATMLPAVHVLDLSKDGYITPHVDSKFCGRRIAGLSLLSTAIMRLKRENSGNAFADILLQPRSLYIMRDQVRYVLTHELLSEETSSWRGEKITRERRIAVIMREEPTN